MGSEACQNLAVRNISLSLQLNLSRLNRELGNWAAIQDSGWLYRIVGGSMGGE